MKNNKKAFSLFEILLAVIIISVLASWYLKKGTKPTMDEETKKAVESQGIDTRNYTTTLQSTQVKINGIEKQIMDRGKEVQGQFEGKGLQ